MAVAKGGAFFASASSDATVKVSVTILVKGAAVDEAVKVFPLVEKLLDKWIKAWCKVTHANFPASSVSAGYLFFRIYCFSMISPPRSSSISPPP